MTGERLPRTSKSSAPTKMMLKARNDRPTRQLGTILPVEARYNISPRCRRAPSLNYDESTSVRKLLSKVKNWTKDARSGKVATRGPDDVLNALDVRHTPK